MTNFTSQRIEREQLILERVLKGLPRFLAGKCPTLSHENPGLLKRQTLHLMKALMRPFPGRPKDPEITEALRLKDQGLTWTQVVRRLHPECVDWPKTRLIDTSRRYQSARRSRARLERKTTG